MVIPPVGIGGRRQSGRGTMAGPSTIPAGQDTASRVAYTISYERPAAGRDGHEFDADRGQVFRQGLVHFRLTLDHWPTALLPPPTASHGARHRCSPVLIVSAGAAPAVCCWRRQAAARPTGPRSRRRSRRRCRSASPSSGRSPTTWTSPAGPRRSSRWTSAPGSPVTWSRCRSRKGRRSRRGTCCSRSIRRPYKAQLDQAQGQVNLYQASAQAGQDHPRPRPGHQLAVARLGQPAAARPGPGRRSTRPRPGSRPTRRAWRSTSSTTNSPRSPRRSTARSAATT